MADEETKHGVIGVEGCATAAAMVEMEQDLVRFLRKEGNVELQKFLRELIEISRTKAIRHCLTCQQCKCSNLDDATRVTLIEAMDNNGGCFELESTFSLGVPPKSN